MKAALTAWRTCPTEGGKRLGGIQEADRGEPTGRGGNQAQRRDLCARPGSTPRGRRKWGVRWAMSRHPCGSNCPGSNQHMAPATSSLPAMIWLPQETQSKAPPFPTVTRTQQLPVLPTLQGYQAEKLRSRACGWARDGASKSQLAHPLAAVGSTQDTQCDVQKCPVDVPVELASQGIPLQPQREAGAEVHVQADGHTDTQGTRAVFRAGPGLWQGESRTKTWCRGWCSHRP